MTAQHTHSPTSPTDTLPDLDAALDIDDPAAADGTAAVAASAPTAAATATATAITATTAAPARVEPAEPSDPTTPAAPGVPAPPSPPATVPLPPAATPLRRVLRGLAAVGWSLLGFGVIVAIWQFGSWRIDQLPAPGETFTQMREALSDPFFDNGPNEKGEGTLVYMSLQRVFSGFGLAALVGVPLGLAMGTSRRVWQALNPVVQVMRPISPLAWFPIWLVVYKEPARAAVWVIFITALWPILIGTAAGAAEVPADQRNVARVFRFGRLAYTRHVLIPNAVPQMVTGLRLSMGISWMVIVAVEMLGTLTGIGNSIWVKYNGFNLDRMMADIIIIGVIGLVLDVIFLRLNKAVAIEEAR